MSAQCEVVIQRPAGNPLGLFERYLTFWVFLCILAGISLGSIAPEPFQFIGGLELAKVNIPVALLIWLMIIPMLLKIDFSALTGVREHWKGIGGDAVRQLGGEAIFHGAAGLAVHSGSLCPLPTGGSDRFLYCRFDPARGGALHGDGLCLESPEQW